MNFNRRHFIGAAIAACAGASANRTLAEPSRPPLFPSDEPPMPAAKRPPLLDEALAALDRHGARVLDRDRIGLVDFGLPSSEPRFHLVDVAGGKIEQSWLVSHGSGSDPAATGMLQRFSNQPGSNASSRGAYLVSNDLCRRARSLAARHRARPDQRRGARPGDRHPRRRVRRSLADRHPGPHRAQPGMLCGPGRRDKSGNFPARGRALLYAGKSV